MREMEATPVNVKMDFGGIIVKKLESIPVPLVLAATGVPVRKRQVPTNVCVLSGSLENIAKWESLTLVLPAPV